MPCCAPHCPWHTQWALSPRPQEEGSRLVSVESLGPPGRQHTPGPVLFFRPAPGRLTSWPCASVLHLPIGDHGKSGRRAPETAPPREPPGFRPFLQKILIGPATTSRPPLTGSAEGKKGPAWRRRQRPREDGVRPFSRMRKEGPVGRCGDAHCTLWLGLSSRHPALPGGHPPSTSLAGQAGPGDGRGALSLRACLGALLPPPAARRTPRPRRAGRRALEAGESASPGVTPQQGRAAPVRPTAVRAGSPPRGGAMPPRAR